MWKKSQMDTVGGRDISRMVINGEEGPGSISFSPTLMHDSATNTKDLSRMKDNLKQARSVSIVVLIQPLKSFFLHLH